MGRIQIRPVNAHIVQLPVRQARQSFERLSALTPFSNRRQNTLNHASRPVA